MLYRLFPYDPEASAGAEGTPLYVPRALQGRGRHDNPAQYGALYASREVVSAVAEHLQRFRRQQIRDEDLRWERGLPYAVAALDDSRLGELVDLDDPAILGARGLRPSGVATRARDATQDLALGLYREGRPGIAWWSTIESTWMNVTLFAERVRRLLDMAGDPEPISVSDPAVLAAAEILDVRL